MVVALGKLLSLVGAWQAWAQALIHAEYNKWNDMKYALEKYSVTYSFRYTDTL